MTLETVTQLTLEHWLTEAGGPGADDVREFLRWAKNRGLTGELTMPVPVPREALTALEQDEHWHQLRRALTEATLPLDVRAAAALALLYGVAFSRIQHLRRDEVEERPDGVYLALDRRRRHRLRLAEPVGDLLGRHLRTLTTRARTRGCFPVRCLDSRSPRDCASGCAAQDSPTSRAPAPPL